MAETAPHPTRTRGAFARRIRGCMARQAASTRSATLQRKAPKSPERKENSPGNRGGVCGHAKIVRSVQKSQLPIEQTEEFVSHLFDAGHLTEAKRLAVTLRVQLTPRPQRILLTIDLSEVSGVSDGGEFIRVRRRVLRPQDGSLPE